MPFHLTVGNWDLAGVINIGIRVLIAERVEHLLFYLGSKMQSNWATFHCPGRCSLSAIACCATKGEASLMATFRRKVTFYGNFMLARDNSSQLLGWPWELPAWCDISHLRATPKRSWVSAWKYFISKYLLRTAYSNECLASDCSLFHSLQRIFLNVSGFCTYHGTQRQTSHRDQIYRRHKLVPGTWRWSIIVAIISWEKKSAVEMASKLGAKLRFSTSC